MRLTKQWITTNSYTETFTLSDDLINDYRNTLEGTDKEFSDSTPDNYDFVLEMEDDMYEWLYQQNIDKNPKIVYDDNEELIDSYFNEYYLDKE